MPNATVAQFGYVRVCSACNESNGPNCCCSFYPKNEQQITEFLTLFIVERVLGRPLHRGTCNTVNIQPKKLQLPKKRDTASSTYMQVKRTTQKELKLNAARKRIAYLFACSTCIVSEQCEYLAGRCLSNFSFKIEIKHLTSPNYCPRKTYQYNSKLSGSLDYQMQILCLRQRGVEYLRENESPKNLAAIKVQHTRPNGVCSVPLVFLSLVRYISCAILFISSVYFHFIFFFRQFALRIHHHANLHENARLFTSSLKNENFLPTTPNELLNDRRRVAW